MALTGGKGLDALRGALAKLPAKARREAAKAAAEEAESLALQGFHDSKAPDGEAWKPLKRRQGDPLRRTSGSGLMGSIQGRPDGTEVRLGTTVEYGVHHQFGALRAGVPQRQFLPMQDEPLPEPWDEALASAGEDAVEDVMADLGLR